MDKEIIYLFWIIVLCSCATALIANSSSYHVNFATGSGSFTKIDCASYNISGIIAEVASGNISSNSYKNRLGLQFSPTGEAIYPTITLIGPLNYTNLERHYDITFNFSANTWPVYEGAGLTCNLTLDENFNQTLHVNNNINSSFLIAEIPFGSHNWSVKCNDTNNNIVTSETWLLDLGKFEMDMIWCGSATSIHFNVTALNPSLIGTNATKNISANNQTNCLFKINNTSDFTGNLLIYLNGSNINATLKASTTNLSNNSIISVYPNQTILYRGLAKNQTVNISMWIDYLGILSANWVPEIYLDLNWTGGW